MAGYRRWWRIAGFVPALFAPSVLAATVSCATLDQVAAGSSSNFRSISAPRPGDDSDDPDMKPAVYLPGANLCYVDLENGVYTCSFKTAATVAGSTVWGPTHLAYLVDQFQNWVATCGGYKGDYRYINRRTFRYKDRYPISLSVSLYWDTGEFIAAISRKEIGE